jgi:hypothetical protein
MTPTMTTLTSLRAAHAPLARAEQETKAATAKADAARAELRRLDAECTRLPGDVAAGRSAPAALEQAVRLRNAAALALPAAERAITEAEARVAREIHAAVDVVAASIRARREKLRRELPAAKVKELQRFVDAERELYAETISYLDAATGACLLDGHDVGDFLTWPESFGDVIAIGNYQRQAGALGSPTAAEIHAGQRRTYAVDERDRDAVTGQRLNEPRA